jgi:RNA polymerase-binding transcription factor DksA
VALTAEQIADNKRRNDEWNANIAKARKETYERRKKACDEWNAAHADDTSDEEFIDQVDGRWLIMGGGRDKLTPWDLEYKGYAQKSSATRRLKQHKQNDENPDYGRCSMCGFTQIEQAAEDFCGIKSINCAARRHFPNKYKGTTDAGLPHIQTMNGLASMGGGRMGVYTVNSLVTPDGDVPVKIALVRELKGAKRSV